MNFGKKVADIKNNFQDKMKNIDFDPDKRIDSTKEFNLEKNTIEYNPDIRVADIKELANNYLQELKDKVAFPDLLSGDKLDVKKFELVDSDKVGEMRKEFKNHIESIRTEWEKQTGKEWPRYEENVYDQNGSLIRKKGDCYDAHHIQSLKLGGSNDASNIVPIHALNHYDHTGIHDKNGALNKIKKYLGE